MCGSLLYQAHVLRLVLRKAFAKSLASFIAFLSHGSNASPNSLQIASRLELSQKQQGFYDKPVAVNGEAARDTGLDVAALQLNAVMDLPTVNTRAGLYILFNALVSVSEALGSRLTPRS
jgi:mediator of RNA polymerase II transcription subunit 5